MLSHYRGCKDASCPVCPPVRDTIRKGHEKVCQGQSTGLALDAEMQVELSSTSFATSFGGSLEKSSPRDYQGQAKRQRIDEGLAVPSESLGDPVPKKLQINNTADACGSVSSVRVENGSTQTAGQGKDAQTPEDRFPMELRQKCMDVLGGLQRQRNEWVFSTPVDPVVPHLPGYFEIVKEPMDLDTIRMKLASCAYHEIGDFRRDVNLTFDNAIRYEGEGPVSGMAKELQDIFEAEYRKLVEQPKVED